MDETKNTVALILNRIDYREADSLVTVYTQNFGKLNLVARGTKKLQSKLAGHLEPISLVKLLIVNGKGFNYVGSALTVEAYLGIKDDLNKLYYAGQALANFSRLVKEGQADQRLFFLTKTWLEVLNDYQVQEFTKESGELLLNFFLLKLLSELGYQPNVNNCLLCQEKLQAGENYFDLKSGGIICGDCYQPRLQTELFSISDNCVKLLRFILGNRFQEAKKLKTNKKLIKELSFLINSFISFQL
jgi:DNA repair protein RecO (recombination protein O)